MSWNKKKCQINSSEITVKIKKKKVNNKFPAYENLPSKTKHKAEENYRKNN